MQANDSTNSPKEAQGDGADGTPEDVVTGLWLWAVALPLMLAGFVVASVTTASPMSTWLVYASTAVLAVTVGGAVVAFLFLARHGYGWARTVLTGGGLGAVAYVASNLFGSTSGVWATVFAVLTIVASVCIVGGIYLLHRKAATEFFTR